MTVERLPFSVERAVNTPYKHDAFQPRYLVSGIARATIADVLALTPRCRLLLRLEASSPASLPLRRRSIHVQVDRLERDSLRVLFGDDARGVTALDRFVVEELIAVISSRAASLRAWPGWTRSSRVEV